MAFEHARVDLLRRPGELDARSGQFEQAITAYKELTQRKDGQLPIDGILIQLGRTYRDAGRASDAQQTFNRLVEEFPDSPFNAGSTRAINAAPSR